MIPSSFPYTVVATRDGRRAWCSLWNSSRVAELDLEKGSGDALDSAAGAERSDRARLPSHRPSAQSGREIALRRFVQRRCGRDRRHRVGIRSFISPPPTFPDRSMPGLIPARWRSRPTATRLFVADSSLNAVAVFDSAALTKPGITFPLPQEALGFIPTDWYPSALSVQGDDLLIATAKGEGAGPNSGISQLKSERRHREHPYIATLMYGSLSRLNFRNAGETLARVDAEGQGKQSLPF